MKATHSRYCCIKVHLQHQHLHNHQIQFQMVSIARKATHGGPCCVMAWCACCSTGGEPKLLLSLQSQRVSFLSVQFYSAMFRRSLTSRESVGGRLPVDGGVAVVLGGPGQENTLAISCLTNDMCDILLQLNLITKNISCSLTEAGWHVGWGGLLLLHDILIANWAETLVACIAVETAPVLAQSGVVLLHVAVSAVHFCTLTKIWKKYKLEK